LTSVQPHLEDPAGRLNDYYDAANIALGLTAALGSTARAPFGIVGERADYRVELFTKMVGGRAFLGPRWTHSPLDVILTIFDEVKRRSLFLETNDQPFSAVQQLLSCVYPWVRPRLNIDLSKGPTRLEGRAQSGGFMAADNLADSLAFIALTRYLVEEIDVWRDKVDFADIRANLASATGPDGTRAKLTWQFDGQVNVAPAAEIWQRLAPSLRYTLAESYHTDPAEADELFPYVDLRANTGQTGSAWFAATYRNLRTAGQRHDAALHETTQRQASYSGHGTSRRSVTVWSTAA
jgi:hypothetical protein